LSYRVYYSDFERDIELTPDGARPAEVEEINGLLDQVLAQPGNFLGLIDEQGGILQFLVDEDGHIGVEIPDPARRGHYGKRATLTECKQLVAEADGRFHWDAVDGLQFEKW
jgi:predicted acetyltransferase